MYGHSWDRAPAHAPTAELRASALLRSSPPWPACKEAEKLFSHLLQLPFLQTITACKVQAICALINKSPGKASMDLWAEPPPPSWSSYTTKQEFQPAQAKIPQFPPNSFSLKYLVWPFIPLRFFCSAIRTWHRRDIDFCTISVWKQRGLLKIWEHWGQFVWQIMWHLHCTWCLNFSNLNLKSVCG